MELYAFVLLRRNDCYSFAKKKMLLVYIFVNIQIVEGEFNGPKASGLNGYIYIYPLSVWYKCKFVFIYDEVI